MALQDGFPSASGLADANDVRLALAGLIVRDSSGNPRTGIFLRHANALVTSTATMNSSVAAFEAAVSRAGQGVILLPNNGATNVLHDPAPVANSRYDTIYVKQNDAVSPNADANNLPVFGILKGAPSASPTLPTYATAKTALDAAPGIGAGAEPLTAVLIPSTATSMQSAGVVYTQLYQYTAATGGVVPFSTKTDLDLWATAANGTLALVLATDTGYRRSGGVWKSTASGEVLIVSNTFTAAASVSLTGCFTTEFDNYTIALDIPTHSAGSQVNFRMRSGGTDEATSSYQSQSTQQFNSSNVTSYAATTSGALTAAAATEDSIRVSLFGPKLARVTRWASAFTSYAGLLVTGDVGGRHVLASPYDGITILPGSGTITGTVRVYGYNNG